MANPNNIRHAVAKGDLGFAAAGTPLYSIIKAGSGGRRSRPTKVYNIPVGQMALWLEPTDGSIPVTIAEGDITEANKHRLVWAVAQSSTNTTQTDSFRYLGARKMGNCEIEHISNSSPTCGNDSVSDVYFDCVGRGKAYTLAVSVRDNYTQAYTKAMKDKTTYLLGGVVGKPACTDCPADITCEEVVDAIIKNYYLPEGFTLPNGQPYPDQQLGELTHQFAVHKIYNRSLKYCLSFTGENTLAAFKSATIGGQEVDLSDIVTPTDSSMIYRGQLSAVRDRINQALADTDGVEGRAYVTGNSYHSDCPLTLHVNTNDAGFAITDTSLAVLAATETNPFGAGEPGEGYTCGIRVIAAAVTGDDSDLVNRPDDFLAREVTIEARGEGFVDAKTAIIQRISFPSQFGNAIRYWELEQQPIGMGIQVSGGSSNETWSGAVRKDSRLRLIPKADPTKDYCSYYIRSRPHVLTAAYAQTTRVMFSYLHVESDAATTIAQVEAVLQKLADLSMSCTDAIEVSCTPLETSC